MADETFSGEVLIQKLSTRVGLIIDQADLETEAIALQSDDVAHGMTSVTDTSTYGFFQKASSFGGGVSVHGLGLAGMSEDSVGIRIVGYSNPPDAPSTQHSLASDQPGIVEIDAWAKNGGGVLAAAGPDNILAVKTGNLSRFIVNAQGDIWSFGDVVPGAHIFAPVSTGAPSTSPASRSGLVALGMNSSNDTLYYFKSGSGWTPVAGSGGGGGGLTNAYAAMSDGSNTASAASSDTFQFVSSDSSVSLTVSSGSPDQLNLVVPTMTGANGSSPGTKGLVPQPAAADNLKFLRGDGTWQTVSGGGGSFSSAEQHTWNALQTFVIAPLMTGSPSGANGLRFRISGVGASQDHFVITMGGELKWGPGNNNPDTNLKRISANLLGTDDSFSIGANLLLSGAMQLPSAGSNDFDVDIEGGSTLLHVDRSGSVVPGLGSTDRSRSSDFLYASSTLGIPNGTPDSHSGRVPIAFDTLNNDMYVYNGSWLLIGSAASAPAPVYSSVSPTSLAQGASSQNLTISGSNFANTPSNPTVQFSGTGVTVNSVTFDSATQLTVNVSIGGSAATGARDITVTNSDTQSDTGSGVFTITDGIAPSLSAANIDGASLVLTYDENLDESSEPANNDFDVDVNSSGVSLTGAPNVSGATVTITLASAVQPSDDVSIDYTPPMSNAIQDAAGNKAIGLNGQEVTNDTGDTTAPVFQSAAVDGSSLVLTYDEALDTGSVPATGDFTVQVESNGRSVSNVGISGSTVTLTLASAVVHGESVTVGYTPGTNKIRDAAQNESSSFSGQSVSNNTIAIPALQSAAVDDDTLVLTYDITLDSGSTPATGDFTVSDDYESQSVDSVVVSGTTVTLTLSPGVLNDSTILVTYTKGSNPIETSAGGEAIGLTNQAVTNNTNISIPTASHAWTNLISGTNRADSIGSNDATWFGGGGVNNVWTLASSPFGLPEDADTVQFSALFIFTLDSTGSFATLLSEINGSTLDGISMTVGHFSTIGPSGGAAGDVTWMVDDGSTDDRGFLFDDGEINTTGDYVLVITYDQGAWRARLNDLPAATDSTSATGQLEAETATIGAVFSGLSADGGEVHVWNGSVLSDLQMRQLIQDNA